MTKHTPTKRLVEKDGRRCLLIAGDVGDRAFCDQAVEPTEKALGKLDVLVNNAGEQHPQKDPEDKEGAATTNMASITAYAGHKELLVYSATTADPLHLFWPITWSGSARTRRSSGLASRMKWPPPSSFWPPSRTTRTSRGRPFLRMAGGS